MSDIVDYETERRPSKSKAGNLDLAAMREHIKVVFEGKIARAFVQNAARAGLDVVNPDHKVQFIRGWAKDKGLLMGLAYEAWDEIASVSPLANDVIVYGPRDSIVSQLLNKYQAKVYAAKRKGCDGMEEDMGALGTGVKDQGGLTATTSSAPPPPVHHQQPHPHHHHHHPHLITQHHLLTTAHQTVVPPLVVAVGGTTATGAGAHHDGGGGGGDDGGGVSEGSVVYVVEQLGLQKEEAVAVSGILTHIDHVQEVVTLMVAAFGWCINDPQPLPLKQSGLLEQCESWKDMFEAIVANMPDLHAGMYSFTTHKRSCYTASTIPEHLREQFVNTWMAVQAVAQSTASNDTSLEDSLLAKKSKTK